MLKLHKKHRKHEKTRTLVLLASGLSIIVAIALAALVVTRRSQAVPAAEGVVVPFYYGTSIHGHINFAPHFIHQLLNYTSCANSTCIIMFGLKSCPHCHAMYEFFMGDEVYSSICRVFWVDSVGSKELELFFNLVNTEIMSGVNPAIARGVPQTVVVRNGSIEAVVIGEVESKDFWDRLISSI